MKSIEINGQKTPLNNEGFLIDRESWNKEVAAVLAKREGIVLTEHHWQLIMLLRDFYQEYQLIPPLRIVIKTIKIKLGDELANSIAVHKLFGENPLKIACKISGLPKPKHCM